MPRAINWRWHKVGGIFFWKLGRLGGSFYVARRVPRTFEWQGEPLGYEGGRTMVVVRDCE